MLSDIYREEILENYRNPQNFGKLEQYNISSKQTNPFCGDEIEIFIKFEPKFAGAATNSPQGCKAKQGCKIKDIKFLGKGCAISVAASSLLTEYSKRKSKEQLTKFSEDDMLDLLGIRVSETRKKCAMLPLAVLKDCI